MEAHQFYPLVEIQCSPDLRFFLCSIYTPICLANFAHALPPCRSVCERARHGCAPIMAMHNFSWPARMHCDQFPQFENPEGLLCMDKKASHEANTSLQLGASAAGTIGSVVGGKDGRTGQDNDLLTYSLAGDLGLPGAGQSDFEEATDEAELLQEVLREKEAAKAFPSALALNRRAEAIFMADSSYRRQMEAGMRLDCSCRCRPPLVALRRHEEDSQFKKVSTIFTNATK
ncbi:unnamed protein product [Protopolystoma xenopodis]|uniref:FZ domain-containing protein n=1 Tax=Protopolystoma xenopodis TaxID=117903 RepID=A0A3S5AU39_9PLAT|nr:unnamed protein product [Protopolystoma xenopodis]